MLNISRKTETASRIELQQVAQIIKEGPQVEMVRHIRDVYHLMSPQRTDDGRVLTHFEGGIKLPRLCFAAEYENRDQKRRMLKYNGLVVLEINGLSTYEQAMAIRNKARRMPQTLLCFLGGSGKSVKSCIRIRVGDCPRTRLTSSCSIIICMRRLVRLIRRSSDWTSRSWSPVSTARSI